MRLYTAIVVFVIFCGCGNSQLKETSRIQQNILDEMTSKIEKLEKKQDLQEQKINSLQTEVNGMRTNVQKVSPGYLEGTIQEGN